MVLSEKARKGEWLAQAPYGFKKAEGNKLVHDEGEMPVLKDMIKKTKEGYSMRQLANYLTDSGVQPLRGYQWHITSIQEMLKNPALHGSMKWGDIIVENTHDGIMSKHEHEHLLKILSERQHKKKRAVNSFFIYQMKLICPTCGNHLTSERTKYHRKKDGGISEHNRYRCQVCALAKRKAVSLSEKVMERAFVDYMNHLKHETIPEQKQEQDQSEFVKNKIARIENQRAKYQRAWANDLMTDDEFSERMGETKSLLNELNQDLDGMAPKQHFNKEDVKRVVNEFNLNWIHLTAKEKHKFLNMFVEGIKFEKDGRNARVTDVLFY